MRKSYLVGLALPHTQNSLDGVSSGNDDAVCRPAMHSNHTIVLYMEFQNTRQRKEIEEKPFT